MKASAVLLRAWAGPTSLLGLLLAGAAALTGGRVRRVDGVLEVWGGAATGVLHWMSQRIAALTLGHVVVGRDAESLEHSRAHERVHVRQCERWGPLFLPLYFGASLWAALRGRHPYRDNVFELEAVRATSPSR